MPSTPAPYGSWRSPISAHLVASQTLRLGPIDLGSDGVYWSEVRPAEEGRSTIVRWRPERGVEALLAAPWSARTRVHEYGGGAFFLVGKDGGDELLFSNFADQRLYRLPADGTPRGLTAAGEGSFADAVADLARCRLICVRERTREGSGEPVNSLVSVDLATGGVRTLATGHDFFASPTLSPDGSQLAWLTWDHPNMPWDGSELWLAPIDEAGELGEPRRVAGGREESIFQPRFSPDGQLYFVSDRTDWWNLYRWEGTGEGHPLHPMEAELGLPQWMFGMSTYAFASSERLICTYSQEGEWRLAELEAGSGAGSGRLRDIPLPYTRIENLQADGRRAVFVAASPTRPPAVVALDLASYRPQVLRSSAEVDIDERYVSLPRAIRFPGAEGRTAHAFFYPPRNADFDSAAGSTDEKPMLLVKSHGGPTAAASTAFSPEIQFWTSRGFAVVDVNYGGSTGYGRAYRQRLAGRWGIVDVDDCVGAARFLAEAGEVDAERLAIRGGSAGGYTTLAALAFRDLFSAGASHYGIGDLEALLRDTHKFESRYLEGLLGPYPERRELYRERSPLYAADRISCPVIFFQGLEDRVVPPNQAEAMVEALRSRGVPVAYVPFAGEQHGFRRAESICRALEAELYFYARVFGFELAEEVEPVDIEGMED